MYFVATNQVGELEAEKVWQARQRYHVIGRDSSLPLGLSRRGIMVTVVLVRMLKRRHEGRHLEGMLGPGRQTGQRGELDRVALSLPGISRCGYPS